MTKQFFTIISTLIVLTLFSVPVESQAKGRINKKVVVHKTSKGKHIASSRRQVRGYAGIIHPIQLPSSNENRQLLCLADNIYFEGRGEPISGQIEIGYVTVERTRREGYPDSICGVVKQEGQFSWYSKRKNYKIVDEEAWHKALLIARGVRIGILPNRYKGATHFHVKGIRPNWSRSLRLAGVIDNHKFYRPKE